MLARLQRLIVCGLLAIAGAWSVTCWTLGHPVLSVVGTLLLVFSYAVVIAVELIISNYLGALEGEQGAKLVELLRAWWGEIWVSPQVFFWRQPFRTTAEADSLPSTPTGERALLLVHGFVCNRAFWNPWMTNLRRAGISFVAVDLEPPFGSISSHAGTIDDAVGRLTVATGVPPLVVAHSMGGLAVRQWLAERAEPERVYRIVTIGTPHSGTWLARFSRTVPGTEMAVGSAWLQRLEQLARSDQNLLFTCFYGNADNVVFPASFARLRGADNRLIKATAHVQLAFHAAVFDEVMRCLRAPSQN